MVPRLWAKRTTGSSGIDWLYKQVIVGNYHLFDYAELYDKVYCRLFGYMYFSQLLFPSIPIYQEEKVDERRMSIHLPDSKTWHQLKYPNLSVIN